MQQPYAGYTTMPPGSQSLFPGNQQQSLFQGSYYDQAAYAQAGYYPYAQQQGGWYAYYGQQQPAATTTAAQTGPSGEQEGQPPLPGGDTEAAPPLPPGTASEAAPSATTAAAAPPPPPAPPPGDPPPSSANSASHAASSHATAAHAAHAAGAAASYPPSTADAAAMQAQQQAYAAYYGQAGAYDPAYAAYYAQYPQYAQLGAYGQGAYGNAGAWGNAAAQGYPNYAGQQQQQQQQGQGQGVYPIGPPPSSSGLQQQQQRPSPWGPPLHDATAALKQQQSSASSAAKAAANHDNSYNAVPPPSSLGSPAAKGITGFSIKPQTNKRAMPAVAVNPLASSPAVPSTSAPAYVKVGLPSAGPKPSAPSPVVNTRPATAAAAATPAPRKFPPTFTAWVERCFGKCKTNEDRQAMTALLTAKIKEVEKAGRMWLLDWDQEPLPTMGGAAGAATTVVSHPAHRHHHHDHSAHRDGDGRAAGPRGSGGASDSQWKRGRRDEDRPEDYDRDDSDMDEDRDGDGGERDAGYGGRGYGGRGARGRHGVVLDGRGRGAKAALKKRKKGPALAYGEGDEHAAPHEGGGGVDLSTLSAAERSKLEGRAGRFGDGRALGGLQSWQRRGPGPGPSRGRGGYGGWHQRHAGGDSDDSDADELRGVDWGSSEAVFVKGTSTALEKSYYRLTAAPDASVVRPEPVLRQALDRLVGMLRDDNANWLYACDQFKGMRQDCTVQHLRNALAVEVYEAHGRAALEYGDLAEFNQCQTQLHGMYADNQPGCVAEFTAYKILYETAHASRPGVGRALLHTIRTALAKPDVAGSLEVRHALSTRRAVMTSDYSAFSRLYASAPHLGRSLLDMVAPQMRWAALNVVVKAFKTQVPLSFLAPALGFTPPTTQPHTAAYTPATPSVPLPGCRLVVYEGRAAAEANEAEGLLACGEWLRAHGAVVEEGAEGPQLDVKSSLGKLAVPEEPKVAHGDENLSLGDFLSAAAKKAASVYL